MLKIIFLVDTIVQLDESILLYTSEYEVILDF